MPPGAGRDHLRPGTAVHVPAERGQRLRPDLDGRPPGPGDLRRCLPPERSRAEHLQLRVRRRGRAVPPLRRLRGRGAEAGRGRPAAAGLRAGVQGQPQLQPAGCAPRHLRDRAPALHPARAHPRPGGGPGLLRPAREARLPGTEAGLIARPAAAAGTTSTQTQRRPDRTRPGRTAEGKTRMATQLPLLIELGTEELPVKALPGLAQAFFDGVVAALEKRGVQVDAGEARPLYTPRRLAVLLPGVAAEQPEQHSEVLGPYVNI